jgi:hypothetical protein
MPVTIPDQILSEAGLSEQEAKLEIACRFYDAGKLTMPQARAWLRSAESSSRQLCCNEGFLFFDWMSASGTRRFEAWSA